MPLITPQLPFDAGDAVWLTSVYLLCTVAPMPVTGRLGDKYGPRPVFLCGLSVFGLGLALAGFAWSWPTLVLARAVQGVGAALFVPQAFGLIHRVFPSQRRGRAFAVWGVIGSVASLIGPVAGGVVVDISGWRAAFYVQAGLSAVAFITAYLWLPRIESQAVRLDFLSAALTFAALGAFVYGIQFQRWSSLAVALVAVILLVRRAVTGRDDGFLPVALFRNRNFALGTVGIAMMGFAIAAMFLPIMYWLHDVAAVSASFAGLVLAPMSLTALALTPVAGVLADRLHPRLLQTSGFSVVALALCWAAVIIFCEASAMWFFAVTALVGVGSAFVWAPNATTTMRGVAAHDAGAASGLYNTIRQVGSVLGVASVGMVLAAGSVNEMTIIALLPPISALCIGAVTSLFFKLDVVD